ncbi:hypothetical protein DB345_17270 [Spartobacteria bacterium LR76]|nr:hypothetical protein DB345_17270 [Spartobacteria bacterium LR76]
MSPVEHQPDSETILREISCATLFPKRSLLTINEVAEAWKVDPQHVTNMIDCGDLRAIDLRTQKPPTGRKKHKSFRRVIRIPVGEFDRVTKERFI